MADDFETTPPRERRGWLSRIAPGVRTGPVQVHPALHLAEDLGLVGQPLVVPVEQIMERKPVAIGIGGAAPLAIGFRVVRQGGLVQDQTPALLAPGKT